MQPFIKIIKHEISNSYLNLDYKNSKEIIINPEYIVKYTFDKEYPNGYGDHFPELYIEMTGSVIQLYRDDAENAYKLLADNIAIIDKDGTK